jgi:hypothetical protein
MPYHDNIIQEEEIPLEDSGIGHDDDIEEENDDIENEKDFDRNEFEDF